MCWSSLGAASVAVALLPGFTVGRPPHTSVALSAQSCPSTAPTVDHHQHLLSPAAAKLVDGRAPRTAEQLVAELDDAGIARAVVLSNAYWFGSPRMKRADGDEYANVRAENDWTARETAGFATRLTAFCAVNPLKAYALAEIDRCANARSFRGLKLHFGNSGVDLRNPNHVATLRQVFAAANARGLPVTVHLWTGTDYGRADAVVFLEQILPVAPDIPVQIAHFAGGGPGYTDAALGVYADAIAARDQRTAKVYFDLASVANDQPDPVLRALAARIRQVGPERVLFGSDMTTLSPRQAWATFCNSVPLSADELRQIAKNAAPFVR